MIIAGLFKKRNIITKVFYNLEKYNSLDTKKMKWVIYVCYFSNISFLKILLPLLLAENKESSNQLALEFLLQLSAILFADPKALSRQSYSHQGFFVYHQF